MGKTQTEPVTMRKTMFGAIAGVVSVLGVASTAAPGTAGGWGYGGWGGYGGYGGCGYSACGVAVVPQYVFPSCGCGPAIGYVVFAPRYGVSATGGYGEQHPEVSYPGYGYPGIYRGYGYRGIYRGIGWRGVGYSGVYRGVGYRGVGYRTGLYRPAFHGARVGRWR